LNIDVRAKVTKPVQKYSLKKKVLNFSVAGKMLLISGQQDNLHFSITTTRRRTTTITSTTTMTTTTITTITTTTTTTTSTSK
jgi:hypothetical protein